MAIIADCPCDCAMHASLDVELERMLSRLEIRVGTPLFISSAGRCKKHNAEVGGSETSKHLIRDGTALAVDVYPVLGTKSPTQIAHIANKMGFKGIGIYKGHVHLDMRPTGLARWPKELW